MDDVYMTQEAEKLSLTDILEFIKKFPEFYSIKGQHYRVIKKTEKIPKEGIFEMVIVPFYINGDSRTNYLPTQTIRYKFGPYTALNVFQYMLQQVTMLNTYELLKT